ncbi:hypothetical protein M0R45_013881 [Rubus argutus]|uniref:Uncharacterized protein n=1 Tax=Rubus argutus TaxID=59490 RepID=A0AAW1XLU9_RUBAR
MREFESTSREKLEDVVVPSNDAGSEEDSAAVRGRDGDGDAALEEPPCSFGARASFSFLKTAAIEKL